MGEKTTGLKRATEPSTSMATKCSASCPVRYPYRVYEFKTDITQFADQYAMLEFTCQGNVYGPGGADWVCARKSSSNHNTRQYAERQRAMTRYNQQLARNNSWEKHK